MTVTVSQHQHTNTTHVCSRKPRSFYFEQHKQQQQQGEEEEEQQQQH